MKKIPRMSRNFRRHLIHLGRRSGDPETAVRFHAVARLGLGRSSPQVAADLMYIAIVSAPYRAPPPPSPAAEDPDVVAFRWLVVRGRRASWLLWLAGAALIALWAFAPGSPVTTFSLLVAFAALFACAVAAWLVQTVQAMRKRRARAASAPLAD